MAIAGLLNPLSKPPKRGRRGNARHALTLRTTGSSASSKSSEVLVKNISASGLLIETAADLRAGNIIDIDLPEVGVHLSRVVWADAPLFGCTFDHPLSRASLSAAKLLSEPGRKPSGSPKSTAEVPWGQRLKHLRIARGFSLVEFARLMHVSRPTVWSWEAGRSSPRAAKRSRVLEVLGVSDADLRQPGKTVTGNPLFVPGNAPPSLKTAVEQAKQTVAEVAGVVPDQVKLTIEM